MSCVCVPLPNIPLNELIAAELTINQKLSTEQDSRLTHMAFFTHKHIEMFPFISLLFLD